VQALHALGLLLFEKEELERGADDFYRRVEAVLLHRSMASGFRIQLITSDELVTGILESFPWSESWRPETLDLRQLVLEDLARANRVEPWVGVGWTCAPEWMLGHVPVWAGVAQSWISTAWAIGFAGGADSCVLGWSASDRSPDVRVENGASEARVLPVVADRKDWANACDPCGAWPNISAAVESYHLRSDGLAGHSSGRGRGPVEFTWTSEFIDTVEELAVPAGLLKEVVKAIAKRVYGIVDEGLGDEIVGGIGRFRVTRYWRIHYRPGVPLTLLRFGPHDMDGIS
jgi:hypothetical protein